ncbi:hypothetical protein ACWKWC_20760 [Geodermatophilus nigrescens]|uniref:Uncharacterized protein n=1 Tax=Geodermatophilus nigrescens TaxID=1070870 RepID=A0A1M5EDJ0_9ACTN|nr:hypothetical protein [Geodermatophilus nigrescens]SHF77162.1 hypothetical protein SAMN05444351_0747 [Geodermatophilus nigrescens]
MSVLPAGDPAVVLLPHWLSGDDREELAGVVRAELAAGLLHPVAAVHLADVLTELHVAAARDAVWPAPAARVRRVTGWADDVLPVRLSAAEHASVLALGSLSAPLRATLAGRRA